MRNVLLVVVLLVATLAPCRAEDAPTSDNDRFARHFIELVQANDYQRARPSFAQKVGDVTQESFTQFSALFPRTPPLHVETLEQGDVTIQGRRVWQAWYQFEYSPTEWVVVNIVLAHDGNKTLVYGLHIRPYPCSQQEWNSFSLSGKPLASYAWLVLSWAVMLFCLGTAIVAGRTPMKRRKWLWVIYCFVGMATFWLDWSSGAIGQNILIIDGSRFVFNLFMFTIPAVHYWHPANSPMAIAIAFPLGAVNFWLVRKRLASQALESIGSSATTVTP